MQDYGGPVGFRLFSQQPERVKGFVIQNANAYLEGVGDLPKQMFLPLWQHRDATTEAAARGFLAADTTRFQYQVGARTPEAISPDNWTIDQALLDRPGTEAYQLDLLENYKTNVALYDSWHAAFRQHQPKTLIVWGKHDPFFIPAGAKAFKADLPRPGWSGSTRATSSWTRTPPPSPPRSSANSPADPAQPARPRAAPAAPQTAPERRPEMTTTTPPGPRPGMIRPVMIGGLLAGTLDAIDGVAFNGLANGLNPIQVLQYIASGFYGARSFQMGLFSAAVGAAAHYFIALVLAAIYVVAARLFPVLNRYVVLLGSGFGVAVFLTMNFVVLPLTHVVATPITPAFLINGLIGHALFVGVAIAWAAARAR